MNTTDMGRRPSSMVGNCPNCAFPPPNFSRAENSNYGWCPNGGNPIEDYRGQKMSGITEPKFNAEGHSPMSTNVWPPSAKTARLFPGNPLCFNHPVKITVINGEQTASGSRSEITDDIYLERGNAVIGAVCYYYEW